MNSTVSSSQVIVSTTTGNFCPRRDFRTKAGRTLKDIMDYENSDVVARLAREEKLSIEDAHSIFKDILLFLWLGNHVGAPIAPTARIDYGWHAFLLFTQDYREFCQTYFGTFIDHHPRRLTDKRDGGEMVTKSRDFAEMVLAAELGLSLSRNWLYEHLEKAVLDGAPQAVKCCGNCGSDCCKR